MSIQLDGKGVLVDALKVDRDNFQISNLILTKKGPVAVRKLYALRNDLLKFAHDPSPDKEPYLPPAPQEPDVEGLPAEVQDAKMQAYEDLKRFWEFVKDAQGLKVPKRDYFVIFNYVNTYERALHSTAAIKGKRFFALTKNVGDEKKSGGGFLGMFGDKD